MLSFGLQGTICLPSADDEVQLWTKLKETIFVQGTICGTSPHEEINFGQSLKKQFCFKVQFAEQVGVKVQALVKAFES